MAPNQYTYLQAIAVEHGLVLFVSFFRRGHLDWKSLGRKDRKEYSLVTLIRDNANQI